MFGTVDVGAELHAFFGDLAQIAQAEYLESVVPTGIKTGVSIVPWGAFPPPCLESRVVFC